MMTITATLFFILGVLTLCTSGLLIPPTNENIYYMGRIDKSDNTQYTFAWSGAEISILLTGTTSVSPVLDSTGQNYFNVIIDFTMFPMLNVSSSSPQPYNITETLSLDPTETYNIILTKRTEASIGLINFYGFEVDDTAQLLPYPDIPRRSIEFIGDSITCGYGDLGVPPCEFEARTEDNFMTYGALIARELEAELYIEAWSGKGVVRNYQAPNITSNGTFPTFYPLTIPTESTNYWDFSDFQPDAVVINLGTNDFSSEPIPPQDIFQNGYISFVNFIKSKYTNNPTFFLACGPMIGNPCCQYVQNVATTVNAIYIDMQGILNTNDYGCNGHPNVSGHSKMASIASPIIQKNMGW
ncbi:hypothetical protein CYY_001538 [Polysphondylium violaceum]|uniref:Esterase n=1 Tax=Polysphondylium violaceum TaxID=133409 RepID=A0A8J4PZN6_9MYCE|nr:hypothetical protein CYY_001538 [Polysphondylium violaceum]